MERPSDSDGESWRWSRPPRTTPPVIDRFINSKGEIVEFERPATIPDDFVWNPETQSWYPPLGEASEGDGEDWRQVLNECLADCTEKERRDGLISVDQLRAAGALRDPAKRRKKPRVESGLLFDLSDDDESSGKGQPATNDDDAE